MSAPDFLARKAAEVRARPARDARSLDRLREAAHAASPAPSFRAALEHGSNVAVIAEFKRRSPSAGELTDEVPAAVMREYARAGARAASVLTDAAHFGGSLDDLRDAAPVLPALRKDFIVDEAGVLEARAAGAAAVLLIVALLDDRELAALVAACDALALDALVEAHDETEVARALDAGARMLGVNNRDLRALRTDLTVTERLAARVPHGALLVSESGIRSRADVERVRAAGAAAVLVGESLLAQRGAARAALLAELASVPRAAAPFRVKVCGMTSAVDVAMAAALGADAIGVVLWPYSSRAVDIGAAATILDAAPRDVARIGVFVDPSLDDVRAAVETCALGFVQLAGDEPPQFARAVRETTRARVIRVVHVDGPESIRRFADYPADLFLLDAPRRAGAGGTGRSFDWSAAARLPWPRERVVIAGGLRADTVLDALVAVDAAAVDVCSGVEARPGRKDPRAMRDFIESARRGARHGAVQLMEAEA